ncbi:MAG: radical SAM protein [Candidatus Aureabacteria bacterium]|nr:radical SAM protein [Candidatus Auribacterota bacterium]
MLLSWNVTRACNLKCVHCYRDAGSPDRRELDTAEGLSLLGEIARAGFRIVILSGGEPLMRDDICVLIRHARVCGLRPVLGTNGTMLNAAAARALREAGIARVGISIDSANAAYHDRFRGSRGAWAAAIGAACRCREEGVDFQVHTTVTRNNRGDVGRITELACAVGARAHHIFFLVGTGRGAAIAGDLLSAAESDALLGEILEIQGRTPIELKPVCAPRFVPLAREKGIGSRFTRGCLAGLSYCCILPNGEVHPCPYLPVRAGNVRETPFSSLWRESPLFKRLRGMEYHGRCGACAERKSCGGCRARAWERDGDLMGDDPGCAIHRAGVPC